ncbi:MAG: hypothetical protein CBC13_05790 [Planctomycetia bacterium TMED53]|nr:MAG: hypothetical protein CBC13_05790 [Planctomycetia bacterium TMED53]
MSPQFYRVSPSDFSEKCQRNYWLWLLMLICALQFGFVVEAQQDSLESPFLQWEFRASYLDDDGSFRSRDGRITGSISGDLSLKNSESGVSLLAEGGSGMLLLGESYSKLKDHLPQRELTVSCWVSQDEILEWGGLLGFLQDNGDYEKGWVLGSTKGQACLAIASKGADDGNGKLTYLSGGDPLQPGRWYHIAGSYDGERMAVYVDGKLVAESNDQSGDILYPDRAPFVIGAYRDDNEFHPHVGALQDFRLWKTALTAEQIAILHRNKPACASADPPRPPLKFTVAPWLQWAEEDGITVSCETSMDCQVVVEYGLNSELGKAARSSASGRMHHVKLSSLEKGTPHFYKVTAIRKGKGEEVLESPILTFQTKTDADQAFGFMVVGDTQNNPQVTAAVTDLAWGHRPNFVIHCGDLVGTGSNKREWVHEFFAGASRLLQRVPIYPSLGNHEQNAQLYYDYFTLPDPEYYYDFEWGNTHFVVIDTNKPIRPDSDQVRWLEKTLARSSSDWKVVYHHHPAWTSDENDYGNTWKGSSTQGVTAIQKHLVPIYEKHGVDVVFNGHIHVYERTWPIRNGKTVGPGEGVVYITGGGGGGHLEGFAPNRTWFSNNKRVDHHFLIVNVNGKQMEISAYDIDGRLFDRIILD